MKYSKAIKTKFYLKKIGKFKLIGFLLVFIIVAAIFQDYLFSKIQNTGFYLTESLLYNIFWLFFLPLFLLTRKLPHIMKSQNKFVNIIYAIGIGLVVSFLHIILFTICFVFISNSLFDPPHRFSSIYNTVLSNQYYLAFIFYSIAPYIYSSFLNSNPPNTKAIPNYTDTLPLKGAKEKAIKISCIQVISTNKPYAIIHTDKQKYLQHKSLKDFEKELDPLLFLRVHRSAIVNREYIKELKSRKNGDYDAMIENGLSIRFSRHYRKNWKKLLQ